VRLKSVINLFGGPGIGKSTMAADLFVNMKKQGLNVELITEYAKDLTWEKRKSILVGDQIYIFAKQHRRLLRIIDQVDIAICESPLLLPLMYFNSEEDMCDENVFNNIVVHIFKKYPNINYFIERDKEDAYQTIGRNQSEVEALEVDKSIIQCLETHNVSYFPINRNDSHIILDYAMQL